MWIMTTRGFISAVVKPDEPSLLMVRARDPEHLSALFPAGDIIEQPRSDYRWRVMVEPVELAATLAAEAGRIDYSNFKSETRGNYHIALMGCWSALLPLQRHAERLADPRAAYEPKALTREVGQPWDYLGDWHCNECEGWNPHNTDTCLSGCEQGENA